MEKWQIDFEWLRIKHFIKDQIGRTELPDMNAILFLIGIQELGKGSMGKFTKEEKRDLMHIASCRLLSQEGYYEFKGLDHEGWPHYEQLKPFPIKGVDEQEDFLKSQIIKYFTSSYPAIFEN
ncbi:MAG: hypothetical protein IPQ02_17675 [Saprospiraceae bacterium]|nr:hypothetical protein [Candidatus Defluviibacterium haderslevense]